MAHQNELYSKADMKEKDRIALNSATSFKGSLRGSEWGVGEERNPQCPGVIMLPLTS